MHKTTNIPPWGIISESNKLVKVIPFDFTLLAATIAFIAATILFVVILKILNANKNALQKSLIIRSLLGGQSVMRIQTRLFQFCIALILGFNFVFCGACSMKEQTIEKKAFTGADYSVELDFSSREITQREIEEGIDFKISVTGKNVSGKDYVYSSNQGKGVLYTQEVYFLQLLLPKDEKCCYAFHDFPDYSLTYNGIVLSSEYDKTPLYYSEALPVKVENGESITIDYSFRLDKNALVLYDELGITQNDVAHLSGDEPKKVEENYDYALSDDKGYLTYSGKGGTIKTANEIPTGYASVQIGYTLFVNSILITKNDG